MRRVLDLENGLSEDTAVVRLLPCFVGVADARLGALRFEMRANGAFGVVGAVVAGESSDIDWFSFAIDAEME